MQMLYSTSPTLLLSSQEMEVYGKQILLCWKATPYILPFDSACLLLCSSSSPSSVKAEVSIEQATPSMMFKSRNAISRRKRARSYRTNIDATTRMYSVVTFTAIALQGMEMKQMKQWI